MCKEHRDEGCYEKQVGWELETDAIGRDSSFSFWQAKVLLPVWEIQFPSSCQKIQFATEFGLLAALAKST